MFKAHTPLLSQSVCPQRRKDLLVQTVGGEKLLYDEGRHQAFCLNSVASTVWTQCDGVTTLAQIAAASVMSEEMVLLAVQELRRDGLLEASPEVLSAAILSRREMAAKLGIGAAMLLPVVAAIAAPKAAQAYSGCADCGDDLSQTLKTKM